MANQMLASLFCSLFKYFLMLFQRDKRSRMIHLNSFWLFLYCFLIWALRHVGSRHYLPPPPGLSLKVTVKSVSLNVSSHGQLFNGFLDLINMAQLPNKLTFLQRINTERFHLTSLQPCWCTLNKRLLIISFVWKTNMAATPIVFCVSWDCVKMLYSVMMLLL